MDLKQILDVYGILCNNTIYGGDCYGDSYCSYKKKCEHEDIKCNQCDKIIICGCCYYLHGINICECPICNLRIGYELQYCDVCKNNIETTKDLKECSACC